MSRLKSELPGKAWPRGGPEELDTERQTSITIRVTS